MNYEECEGCQYFDGVDICEASRTKLPHGDMVFPVPIELITKCKRL